MNFACMYFSLFLRVGFKLYSVTICGNIKRDHINIRKKSNCAIVCNSIKRL